MRAARLGASLIGLMLAMSGVLVAQVELDPRDEALLGEPQGRPLSGSELRQATEQVTSLMRCPTCQGLSVADSSAPSALAMRAKAEVLMAAGYSEEQVLEYFESSYGEFIRLAPRPRGFNLLVWIVPILGLGLGVLLVVMRMNSGRKEKKAPATADDGLEEYRERVRREVVG